MTHEEIEAADERLGAYCEDSYDVMLAFMGWRDYNSVIDCDKFKVALFDLLEQADPDTHMELPKDANDEHIHIGDELITNHSKKTFVVTRLQYSRKHAWTIGGADKDDLSKYALYAPCETRHYRKPTFEDVVREMLDDITIMFDVTPGGKGCEALMTDKQIAEYAERFKEAVSED